MPPLDLKVGLVAVVTVALEDDDVGRRGGKGGRGNDWGVFLLTLDEGALTCV